MKTCSVCRVAGSLVVGLALVLVLLGGVWGTTPTRANGNVIYVKANATGANNGTSWQDAYVHLQDALAAAQSGDEIWVAEGVYYPDEGAGQTDDDRSCTFTLKDGVALYGGFAGTEDSRDQRDPAAHPTVLSGDIDKNDTTDNGVVTDPVNIQGNNAYHVVSADSSVSDLAVLDGFIITAGQVDGNGGGMYNDHGSPTLTHVTFSGNSATFGGGMYNFGGNPTLTQVTFSGNSADNKGGGMYNSGNPTLTDVTFSHNGAAFGGGMYNDNNSPTLTDVTFTHNGAIDKGGLYDGSGGGMYSSGGHLSLTGVSFIENTARWGGGMENVNGAEITLAEVTFEGNEAVYNGGGIYTDNSTLTLTNVTFSGNVAQGDGGGGYGGGMDTGNNSTLTLTSVTFSGNAAATAGGGMFNKDSDVTLVNVLIANSTSGGDCVNGNGSLNADSSHNLIADAEHACGLTDGENGNLIGQAPQLGPLTDNGGPGEQVFPLLAGSPAIDAGDAANCPGEDQRGVARPFGAGCDIGAYEFPSLIYVDADATGAGDGTSWQDAYVHLQDALALAESGSEIWVAEGVYYPDEGAGQTGDDRHSTFALKDGVALYGGFAGTEDSRDQRDPTAHPTVLSGDLDQNDATDSRGVVTDPANIQGSNAYHVVRAGSSVSAAAVLDGFIITAGQADGNGGGMYNDHGSPTLTHVTFSGNSATFGGGMFNYGGGPMLSEVTFYHNSGDGGGGIYNSGGSPTLTNVTFSGNTAGWGAGLENVNKATVSLTAVAFKDNVASCNGGGIYTDNSALSLTNVTFSGNVAQGNVGGYGGGMDSVHNSTLTLTNVTFSGNAAATAGGGMYNKDSDVTLVNVLIANSTSGGDCVNGNGSLNADSSHNLIADAEHACGLTDGENGNLIGQDPQLGSLTDYGGPGKQVFPLLAGSPAIDAGAGGASCPAEDQRGVARPQGNGCDIGAFEFDDYTPPTVSAITRADANPTNAAEVHFTVTFSEAVTGVDTDDFSLTTTGSLSGASVTAVSGSGNTYTVTVSTGDEQANGYLTLQVTAEATVTDLAGNALVAGEVQASYRVKKAPIFDDVTFAHWANEFVETLALTGITSGCATAPLRYCPEDPVTRAQMAVFLMRGMHYPNAYTPPDVQPTFPDTAGHWAEDWIEALKAAGLTSGYPDGTYRPETAVTRAQMAVFLLKAIHGADYRPPQVAHSRFGDVPDDHWAKDWIEQLAVEGITVGYPDGTYRPEGTVSRAEMAVFLVKAFGLP